MKSKKPLYITLTIAILVFLIQWAADDILDHQTFVSPHKIVGEVFNIEMIDDETTDENEEKTEAETEPPKEEISGSYNVDVTDELIEARKIRCLITSDAANIRSGAGMDNDIVAEASNDVEYTVIGMQNAEDEVVWYKIEINDEETGFISEKACIVYSIDDPYVKEEEIAENEELTVEEHDPSEFVTVYDRNNNINVVGSTERRLTDKELSAKLPDLVYASMYTGSYTGVYYLIIKIGRILMFAMLELVIFLCFILNTGERKFIAFLCIVGIFVYGFFFFKDNTTYKYKIDNSHEIISISENDQLCVVRYMDNNEVCELSIAKGVQQIIVLPEAEGGRWIYEVKKKEKNLWYYITSFNSKKRTLYLIY